MSKYTKITLRLLAAMTLVGSLGACADRDAKKPQDAFIVSVNASSADGELRTGEISKLRVISSIHYNKELNVQYDQVHFTLPSNEKQTLFFVAGERESLSALRATEFNQKEFKTEDYFGIDGKTEPKLYVGSLSVSDGVKALPSPLSLTPTYAKLSYKIRFLDERTSSASKPELRALHPREVTKVWIAKVPPTFFLGGVKTYYTSPAIGYKTFELGKDKTGVCYLPEHDPSDINDRTYIGIEVKTPWEATNNLHRYYVVVHEPYDDVNYGKIIRGRHYKMTVTLPVKIFD